MQIRSLTFALLAAGSLVSQQAHAQPSARVRVQIAPVGSAGGAAVSPAGFTVCVGSASNRAMYGTQTTGSSGEVQFDDLPVGASIVVTANKLGFTGRDETYMTHSGANNNVELTPVGGSGGPACAGAIIAAQPPKATTLLSQGSTAQTAPAGALVGDPPTVKVLDQNGNAMSNVNVAFTVTQGGGSILPASSVPTSSSGIAQLDSWRLGSVPGTNSVTATVGNLSPVTFMANGVPAATTLQAQTPTTITGSAGVPVQQPPGVIVRDQTGTPFAGAIVNFAVTAGGGIVSPSQVTTGSGGVAALNSWSLGTNSGANTVRASVNGLSPVDFTAVSPFSLLVLTKNLDGSALADAQICIGSATDIDQYATVKSAGSVGRATFSIPAATEYRITVSKLTYAGKQIILPAPTPLGNSAASTVSLSPGSGGPICPGAALQADATTTVALPADPLPDLDVKINQTSASIAAGNQQTYTMKIHNKGAAAASSILFRAALPSDLTFVSHRADHSFVCTRSGTTLNCPSGAVLAGDSATITVVMQLSGTASSGHDILLSTKVDPDNGITESNEANNQAAAIATTVAAARLGEEILSVHGLLTSLRLSERGIKTLDCGTFGTAFVVVGIEAVTSQQINHIRVLCSPMQAGGSLSTTVSRTEFFFDTQSTPNSPRKCPHGSAVKGIGGSVDGLNRIINLIVTCQQVVSTGLTANAVTILPPTNAPGPNAWASETCTGNRPARALKVGASSIEGLLAPSSWVVGVQMICEQPVVP